MRDASRAGASFECAECPPDGAVIRLELEMRSIAILVDAEVVWSAGTSFGVKFLNLTPGQRALLSDSRADVRITGVYLEAAGAVR